MISESVHRGLIVALAKFPAACQEMYRLFMSTTRDEDQGALDKKAKKMKELAHTLDKNDKEEFMHHLLYMLIRTKTWLIEKPTSPLLILFETGVNADALSTSKVTH